MAILEQATGEDPRKAGDRQQAHDLLHALEPVAGHHDLIARREKSHLFRPSALDILNVHRNRRKRTVGLTAKDKDLRFVARIQHAARLCQGFVNAESSGHRVNAGLGNITEHAIPRAHRLFESDRNLRIDYIFIQFPGQFFLNLLSGLAGDEDAFRYKRIGYAAVRRNDYPRFRIPILPKDRHRNYIFGPEPVASDFKSGLETLLGAAGS
jgi:hypothetical protein